MVNWVFPWLLSGRVPQGSRGGSGLGISAGLVHFLFGEGG